MRLIEAPTLWESKSFDSVWIYRNVANRANYKLDDVNISHLNEVFIVKH